MKKCLFVFFVLILATSIFIINTFAEGGNSEPVTLFKSIENLQKLNSYRLNQSIVGKFNAEDKGFGMQPVSATGEYKIGIRTDIYNQSTYEINNYSSLRGYLYIDMDGQEKPFNRMVINFRGELANMADDGLYIRLNALTLNKEGVPENELKNYLESKKKFDEEINNIKGIWFHFPAEMLNSEAEHELPEDMEFVLDQDTIKKNLKDQGVKETYRQMMTNFLTIMVDEHEVGQFESEKIQKIINDFFNTTFFTKKIVVAGPLEGFMNYTFSKRRAAQFILSAANTLGEKISENDLNDIWSTLDKFYLSVMTGENEQYGIFDFFRIKLILRNIEELNHLSFNYSYKICKINEIETIEAPDDFMSYEEYTFSAIANGG